MVERKSIKVHWVGAEPGYCRDYYKNDVTGAFYTLTSFRGAHIWHTTDCIDGEPNMPLQDGLIIEVTENGQVIYEEIISRVGDSDSVGLPVLSGNVG